MRRHMGKPTMCTSENKGADQLRSELISAFLFATQIVQFLFLNPKFLASSHVLCLNSSVCVGPVWKPYCWFSHDVAHMIDMKHNLKAFIRSASTVLEFCKCTTRGMFSCLHIHVLFTPSTTWSAYYKLEPQRFRIATL